MSDSRKTHGADGKTDIALIDPDRVVLILDPKDPLFDQDALLPEEHPTIQRYVKSICRRVRDGKPALIEPIVICTRGCVAGRKRVLAARIAKRILRAEIGFDLRITAMVAKKNDDASCLADMIEENTIRSRKNPVVLAEQLARAEASGRTRDELFELSGFKSPKTLDVHLRLAFASNDVKVAVADGRLKLGAAMEIVDLPEEKQSAALVSALNGGGKVHAAKEAAAKERGDKEPVAKMRPKKDVQRFLAALEKVEPDGLGKPALEARNAFLAALRWYMGDDDAIVTIPVLANARLDMEREKTEERKARGRALGKSNKQDDASPGEE